MENTQTAQVSKDQTKMAFGLMAGWGGRHLTKFSTTGLASPSMLPGKNILPYIAPKPASWAWPPHFCCVVEGNNIF